MSEYWTTFMDTFQAKWAIAPKCPFCGSRGIKLETRWVGKPRPHQKHSIICLICGASAGEGETPEMAVDNWNGRTQSEYSPLGEHSYLLPGGQKYQHLMVYERGNISLIDYIEDNQVVAQVDINFGDLRICRWVRGSEEK